MTVERPQIERLVGVYAADGTLIGEITYWVGARFGRAHCSLCDVTHGTFRERDDWKACRATLPVRFETYHRDDQPAPVRGAAGGVTPIVVAETTAGDVLVLLGPDEIEACEADPRRLITAISDAVDRRGLLWPGVDEC